MAGPARRSGALSQPVYLTEPVDTNVAIGAVEIKDASTNDRVSVDAANTPRSTASLVLATQNVDANGYSSTDAPSASSNYAASLDSSVAYETSGVVKASAGVLYGCVGYNSSASARWIQFYNSATVPADAAVPIFTFKVGADSNFSFDMGKFGAYFSAGISWATSSTGPTKTVGAAEAWVNVAYK
jgi:hypothetical protein